MDKLERKRGRLNYLYDIAVGRHLNKCDFDVFEWLTDEEIEEYEKLQKELGEK